MDRYSDLAAGHQAMNNQGWALAQGQATQSTAIKQPVEQPHILAMRDALSDAHQIVNETQSIISCLSDRLFGCDPPMGATASGALQSVPNGSADEALQSARFLCQSLKALRAEASRLESRL